MALELKEGDRVLYATYDGTEFTLDGEEYLVLRESDVLAVVIKEESTRERRRRCCIQHTTASKDTI